MKQFKKNACIGIAAAMLSAAGCAEKQPQGAADVTWENGTVLHLTEQTDEIGMHGLSPTGSGFFYTSYESVVRLMTETELKRCGLPPNEPHYTADLYKYIHYADTESSQTTYLCARPNCLHDGDEFCTATTLNYQILSEPVWLDGYVYAVARDRSEQLSQSNLKYTIFLLRYAPDGTGVTKVAELIAEPQSPEDDEFKANALLIAHRGQLWMKCAYSITKDISDDTLGIAKFRECGGYGMFVYAPADGELTKLYGTNKTEQGFSAWTEYERMVGLDDDIYFYKLTDWQDPLKEQGVFRLDCRTGEAAQLIAEKPNHDITCFSAAGDKLVYYDLSTYTPKKSETRFVAFDLTTGEETPLLDPQVLFESQHPGESAWTKRLDARREPFELAGLLCDESHVFIAWNSELDPEKSEEQSWLTVCDWDGNIAQTLEITALPTVTDSAFIEKYLKQNSYLSSKEVKQIQKNGLKQSFAWFRIDMTDDDMPLHYANGMFYLKGIYQECTISLADLLDGNAEIKPVYFTYNAK